MLGRLFLISLKPPSWEPGHGGVLAGSGATWPGGAGWYAGASARQSRLLTDARPAVRVEGVLLVAATHGARVRVLAAVLAASVSIVTGY